MFLEEKQTYGVTRLLVGSLTQENDLQTIVKIEYAFGPLNPPPGPNPEEAPVAEQLQQLLDAMKQGFREWVKS